MASLQKLAALPGETLVYCAHEYTQANGRFARTVEPGNGALAERLRRVAELRDRNESTVPSTLAEEVATNPFLRPSSAEIRATLGLERAADLQVFVALRCRKDSFKA
ncbi:hydroxyacylglutathione hydrolase C-terminal domain-containing protein [Methylogaea oryzae]|uniref:hydroxyacylglutathione hydrolase C-terminal domain-containing protein n=1 Tax=Methylogaea oryzae TaxID=1295382 RepID=UPI00278BB3FC|nr:hydroxyacylglutathione hydrolase C-terminal domain-containing protein [Methylogaea oryzae]